MEGYTGRPLIELVEILLKNTHRLNSFYNGLCILTEGLKTWKVATPSECTFLYNKLRHCKPLYALKLNGGYWWTLNKEGDKQRREFVREWLRILTREQKNREEPRPLIDLVRLLDKYFYRYVFLASRKGGFGLCLYLKHLRLFGVISYDELGILETELSMRQPQNSELFNAYWWAKNEEGNRQRKQFLKDWVAELEEGKL